jgi:hypothetical protein
VRSALDHFPTDFGIETLLGGVHDATA